MAVTSLNSKGTIRNALFDPAELKGQYLLCFKYSEVFVVIYNCYAIGVVECFVHE